MQPCAVIPEINPLPWVITDVMVAIKWNSLQHVISLCERGGRGHDGYVFSVLTVWVDFLLHEIFSLAQLYES